MRTLFTLFERASDIRAAQRAKIVRRAYEKGFKQGLEEVRKQNFEEGRQEGRQEVWQQARSLIRALLRDAPRGRDPETGAITITISRELRAELLDELDKLNDGDA